MNWMAAAATDSVRAIFTRVANFLPSLLGALLILFVGWILAGWLQKILVRILNTLRLDDFAQRVRVSEILQKGEIRYSVSELLGIFLYWLVLLATLLAALNALGLTVAAELLDRVLSYLPQVLAGVIVLVMGLFFANLVGGIVQTAAANAGVTQAKGLGQISRMVVIIFAAAVALDKFFASIIIQAAFSIIIAAIAFGAALAFGLGCKDIAGKFVGDLIEKLRRR